VIRRRPLPKQRSWRLAPAAAALSCSAALAISACGGSSGSSSSTGAGGSGDPSGSSQTLTLYNAQHEETTTALVKAFTAQTGIKVRVKSDDESVLTAQIEQEGSRSPADVFYTENSNWLQQLDDRGLLAKVNASTLADVPAADSATNGNWLGVSGRFSVMIYNPDKISAAQMPKSVMDLADPKYKGKLELAPGETDFWPIVTSIEHAKGKDAALNWLKAIKSNAGSDDHTPDNETLVSDVSKGDADMGLINHYYFYRLRDEMGAGNFHAKLSLFAPRDPGYVEDISGAAILKSSGNQAAAQKFLAFMASAAGQRVLADSTSFEYPLAKGVAPNPALPPFAKYQPDPITPAQIGTGTDAQDLLQQAGLI
jgi:iron(III) transport system substrate-binding protein